MNTREIDFWIGADDPRISPEHFNEIVATASDVAIVISMDGTIETVVVNPLNQTIGRLDHWINRNMSDFLAEDSRGRFEAVVENFREGKVETPNSVEINHFDNANWDFPIRYTFHVTGRDNTLLMLGRDLRPIAELQQRLVRAQLALEKDYESQRDFETRYRVIMESVRDALVLVDTTNGKVIDTNSAAAQLIGSDANSMVGQPVERLFETRARDGAMLDQLTEAATGHEAAVLHVQTSDTRQLVVEPTMFRAAGDRTLLCRLAAEEASSSNAGAEVSEALNALFASGSDAVVFSDEKGVIRTANDAFLAQCDANTVADVKGRSLGDFLARGNVDLRVLLEGATRTGRMRMYATQINSIHGAKLPVEISTTLLGDGSKARFAFVLRDTIGADVHREAPAGFAANEEHMRNVVDLVGASPLKDIVSATTDVIEKMCIQAAVEMTDNNRVAAAEMLGLSRQSLYVKLRKYGLIDKS